MRKFEIAKGFEDKGVVIPQRKTSKSAGYDIVALADEDTLLSERFANTLDRLPLARDKVLEHVAVHLVVRVSFAHNLKKKLNG